MIKHTIYTLIAVLALQGCSQNTETILFSSSRNGNSDIFIMETDGTNQRALTQSELEEWAPTWINANEISFLRQKGDSINRVKLNLRTREESELKQPSNCTLDDKNVLYSLSNDFQLYSCNNDIFIVSQSTGEILNITEKTNGNAYYPSWDSTGDNVLFTSNHLGSNDIYMYNIHSEATLQLTNSPDNNERGDLSPDGNFLVYSSDFSQKGNQDIVLKNLENGEIKNISNSSGMELIARFSPDGKTIFYGSNKDGDWEIYSYNLEIDRLTRLTNNEEFDGDPRIIKNNN